MTDLIAFGGPAGPCYAQKVAWERPTKVISVAAGTARNTSTDQQAVYQQLSSRDGYAWKAMAQRAAIDPAELGNVGIAGFSAFHGFANAFLKNPADFDKCCYVHLADACFLGAGAKEPHAGYAAFAKQAAAGAGGKLMVATTNGPWGKPLSYSWTYPEGDVVTFNLTSGAQCFELVWNASGAAGMNVSTPEIPPGVPQPTRAMRVGNLIWCHYETMTSGLPKPCGGEYTQHGWHVTALSTPYMQHYGAPWMAGRRGGLQLPGLSVGGGSIDPQQMAKGAIALGVGAMLVYAIWRHMTGDPGSYLPNSFRPVMVDMMPKRCSCGRLYDERTWRKLPLVGFSHFDWGESLEYRNCPCNSTLARTWKGEPRHIEVRAR